MVGVSLYQTCLSKVSNMIVTNYWKTDISPNPFLNYPPSIVNDLIEHICRNNRRRLKSSYLHLLLASGRVQVFKLCSVELETSEAESIFHDLQSSAKILKTIEIKNVGLDGSQTLSNLGNLIQMSKSLTSVETCIGFELGDVFYSQSLKDLTLNYVYRDNLRPPSELRRFPSYNNSLRILKVFKLQININVSRKVADIIQYCRELIEIDYDVAQPLGYLYKENKLQKYKLQKTVLGSEISCFATRASQKDVFIASSVCPNLRSVELLPEDFSAIHALMNFHHIDVLILHKPKLNFNDYHLGVQPLLRISHFGTNLKSLTLGYFTTVDFTSIGKYCPNLEVLKVEYFSADNGSDLPQYAFRKLVTLGLAKLHIRPCEVSTIYTVLSNASALQHLEINNSSTLTDDVLDNILVDKEVLSKLKGINLIGCGLTSEGLKKLAWRAQSLTDINLKTSSVTEIEARSILHDIKLLILRWANQ